MTSSPCLRFAALVVLLAGGCATREHLSPSVLAEVLQRDPKLEQLRVFPSMRFVAHADRPLGKDLEVEGTGGKVEAGYRGQRVELEFSRSLPGAIVAVEVHDQTPFLWVSFDRGCHDKGCALGFVGARDHVFRLYQVPSVAGFPGLRVYRRRVRDRNVMLPSRIYAKSTATQVYMTTRGTTASISLEIKRRDRVDIRTIVVQPTGVDAPK